jgi:hypothetical protein
MLHILQASVIYYIRHETESKRKILCRHRFVAMGYKKVPISKFHTSRTLITIRNFRALCKVALVPLPPHALALVSASAILLLLITVK